MRLSRQTGLEIPRELATDATKARLTIVCDGPGAAVPSSDENESYALEVTADRATLRAPTVVGALRGLETVLQLATADRGGWYLPAVTIQDTPRFRWRGLLIDVARHWMPMDVLKRNLDLMAAVKLNVLHLHLTEDQGFRIESKRYPSLHEKGSDGNFFTQAEMKELIAYAAERGIRVVPEFDIPGHSTSWLVGHPELGSAPGPYSIERTWGIMEPALDPTRDEVYKLLDGFLGEMAALFPDAYLHIGGDENKGKQWMASERITAFMKQHDLADTHALQAYFNKRLLAIVQKHGKKMIGWDEVLHPDLPKDVVVQSWRGPKSLGEAAKQGYSGILSNGYYIDLNYPTSQHYVVDPLPDSLNLTPEEAARVLGGEACMWSEYVDPGNIDSRLWPRLAAIAERFWSPKTVTDVDDVYRRMALFSPWLEIAGSRHITGQGILVRNLAKGGDVAAVGTLIGLDRAGQGIQARRPSQDHAIHAADARLGHGAARELRGASCEPRDRRARSRRAALLAECRQPRGHLLALARRGPGDLRGAGRLSRARRGRHDARRHDRPRHARPRSARLPAQRQRAARRLGRRRAGAYQDRRGAASRVPVRDALRHATARRRRRSAPGLRSVRCGGMASEGEDARRREVTGVTLTSLT